MFRISIKQYEFGQDNGYGICLACGSTNEGGCEPDAENYVCDECGEARVMGYQNALLYCELEIIEEQE